MDLLFKARSCWDRHQWTFHFWLLGTHAILIYFQHLLLLIFFTVKCPFEVSKVWVNNISELWGARDSEALTTYGLPHCALISFLSPVIRQFLWTLFDLHNNPLIYRNFGIIDPIWPVTTERLRTGVTVSVTQLLSVEGPGTQIFPCQN